MFTPFQATDAANARLPPAETYLKLSVPLSAPNLSAAWVGGRLKCLGYRLMPLGSDGLVRNGRLDYG